MVTLKDALLGMAEALERFPPDVRLDEGCFEAVVMHLIDHPAFEHASQIQDLAEDDVFTSYPQDYQADDFFAQLAAWARTAAEVL